MLHDVNPRERAAGPPIERLRHLPAAAGAERRLEVRLDQLDEGGPALAVRRAWFIYGAYRAVETNLKQAGPA